MEKIRKFVLPFFVGGIATLAFSVFMPFLAPYLSGLGFSKSTISLANSIGVLGIIILSPIAGKLSDLLGRKFIITLGFLVEIIALFGLMNKPSTATGLAFILMMQVTAVVIVELVILSDIEDIIKSKKRGFFTGLFESIRSIGVIIGPLIGAILVTIGSIEATFQFSITIITLLILFALLIREKKEKKFKKIKARDLNFTIGIKNFWKNQDLKGMGILGAFMHFSSPAHYVFLPLFITEDLRAPLKFVGIYASLALIFNAFQFFHGWLCDKKGSKHYVLTGALICAFALSSLFFVRNITELFIVILIHSFGASLWNTSSWCYMSGIGEREKKEGQVSGSFESIAKMGAFLSYLISGALVAFFGIRFLFLFYGILIIFAVIKSKKYFYPSPAKNPLFYETSKS